jgi:hypothetical protein
MMTSQLQHIIRGAAERIGRATLKAALDALSKEAETAAQALAPEPKPRTPRRRKG